MEWKLIKDSDGHFYISNEGVMKREAYQFYDKAGRLNTRKEKFFTPSFNKKNGYYSYKYRCEDGSSKTEYAHRIVAFHFVCNPNIEDFNQVNHIDGDKSHNEDTNLEWCNGKLNMEHASKNGLINTESEARKIQAPLNSAKGIHKLFKSVVEYDENGDFLRIYDSYNKIISDGGNKSTVPCHRLSYKEHYFRSYDILIEKYGKIPHSIDISRIENIRNKRRKRYLQFLNNECINIYSKLNELPIKREELWFCFNHDIKDSFGNKWSIENI